MLVLTIGAVCSMSFDKCIRICIHHCSVIQNSFTIIKILCAPPNNPPTLPPPNPWKPLIFLQSIVLSFPEYHVAVIRQYAVFSDWLPSLNYMQLSFLLVSSLPLIFFF